MPDSTALHAQLLVAIAQTVADAQSPDGHAAAEALATPLRAVVERCGEVAATCEDLGTSMLAAELTKAIASALGVETADA